MQKIGNPVISSYLQSLLLTGARRNELAALRWADVDFQWKSLSIRDKVEGERTIPLMPYVEHLIFALPRRNEFVFSSPAAASGRLEEPRNPHNKALTAAALPALSLHGLRRSFGTLSEWVEVPAGIVAQISRAGLTQGEIAQRMGTTQSVIARLEGGKRQPSMRTVQRYAEATGCRAVVRLESQAA